MICAYWSLLNLEKFAKNSSPPILKCLHPASPKNSINSVINSTKNSRASGLVKILKHCDLLSSLGNKELQLYEDGKYLRTAPKCPGESNDGITSIW